MSTAQDEANQYFSGGDLPSTHPEDRDNVSDRSVQEEEKPRPRNLRGGRRRSTSDTEDQDSDRADKMTTTTTTSYTIPSTTHYANTGPKGVIADAQNFHRAKKSSFRNRLSTFTSGFASFRPPTTLFNSETKQAPSNSSDHSDNGLSEEDSDQEFMTNWRAQRMQELSSNGPNNPTRRVSPSRRTWGSLQEVDANGYLDAIEKVSDDAIVIVMIYDPTSDRSASVEDELHMLAYRHSKTRFVKLHHDIAEMETIEVPAVLAYRAGDVFATISGASAQDVEAALRKHRVIE
ncbi:uncharacterized protein HMPREF1541_09969 [Cyphellophora europaea CBS 101466]|uniref:Phosducin domain-containing protein n=1 Tax=Cyphellophora europaea (strain CBS 101466) TaxID=1220924 RepID=W2SAP3_CYPE1|nr:uncharacterized protein HMPREF1541_09969 [Cyphellophora europaea CBS 101466]ETN45093.1 hypothetical protein HMPREF1541_09969 [Cyphellophora europaea CBS 101466]